MMTSSIRTTGVLLAAVAASAALALTGCTSSAHRTGAPAAAPVTATAGASTHVTSPNVTSASVTSASARNSDGTAPASPSVSTSASPVAEVTPRAADPADYHLGSVDPDGPLVRDANQVSFRTPSRNIRCTVLAADEVTCEIGRHTFAAAPRAATCTHNWLGSDVRLDTSGSSLGVCAGDPQVLQNSTVLPYGYRLTVGRIACTSTSAALTCTDSVSHHGFTLSVASANLR